MTSSRLIHNGPAYRLTVSAKRSTKSATAISFSSVWPTAQKPESVQQFEMHLSMDELEALIDFLKDVVTPPF